MSNLIPCYEGRSGARGSKWEFSYGPWTWGQLLDDVDPYAGPLPPIDHSNVAYDSCGTRLSLRGSGIPKDQWDWHLDRNNGPS